MKLGQAARLLLLLLAVAASGVAVVLLAGPWLPGPAAPGVPGFPGLVTSACAVALLACWCWLALGTVVVALEALLPSAPTSGSRLVRVPRTVRVLVPVLVGAALTAAPAGASTGTGPGPGPGSAVGAAGGALAGLPLPDRTVTRHATVPVRPGDNLWAITARLLPAGSTASEVDRGWRRLARANADRVPDPDLIRPGTRLRIPPLTAHPREEAR